MSKMIVNSISSASGCGTSVRPVCLPSFSSDYQPRAELLLFTAHRFRLVELLFEYLVDAPSGVQIRPFHQGTTKRLSMSSASAHLWVDVMDSYRRLLISSISLTRASCSKPIATARSMSSLASASLPRWV